MDFFFRAYFNNIVYNEKICDLVHLKEGVITAIANATLDKLEHSRIEKYYGFNVFHATNLLNI